MDDRIVYVYVLTNSSATIFYVGITVNLTRRVRSHKEFRVEGFSKKYATNRLVYFEAHHSVPDALERYHCIQNGSRRLKIALVKYSNPGWIDLADELGISAQIISDGHGTFNARSEA